MKKISIAIIIAVILTSVIIIKYFNNHQEIPSVSTMTEPTPILQAPIKKKYLIDHKEEKIAKTIEKEIEVVTKAADTKIEQKSIHKIPTSCNDFVNELINMTHPEVSKLTPDSDLKIDNNCLKDFKSLHAEKLKSITMMCKLSKVITDYDCNIKITKNLRLLAIANKTLNIPVNELNFEELGANTTLAFSADSKDHKRNKEIVDTFYDKHSDNKKVQRAYREYLYLLVTDNKYSLSDLEKARVKEIDSNLELPSFESGEFAPWIDSDNYYQ